MSVASLRERPSQRANDVVTAPAPIEALSLTDAEGRRWNRLAPTFVPFASLCSATQTYAGRKGERYQVQCRELSIWASGDTGLCAAHFRLLLVVG